MGGGSKWGFLGFLGFSAKNAKNPKNPKNPNFGHPPKNPKSQNPFFGDGGSGGGIPKSGKSRKPGNSRNLDFWHKPQNWVPYIYIYYRKAFIHFTGFFYIFLFSLHCFVFCFYLVASSQKLSRLAAIIPVYSQ